MKLPHIGFKSAPKFWEKDGVLAQLLSPFSVFYANATAKKLAKPGYRSRAKVICIGNINAGGSGKTPTAIAIAEILKATGKKVHFITTGYGRQTENIGVIRVKAQKAEEVGDEPLLLSLIAPTWVGESRAELAIAAEKDGAEVIIMDDGFQSAEVEKDVSIIVIDGGYGLGNNRVIPAGPLREPSSVAFERAQLVVIIGKQEKKLPKIKLPVFKAEVKLDIPETVKEEDLLAFCGIGRPEKFFASLRARKLKLIEELAFPDHHFYNDIDFKAIFGIANAKKAVIVTTTKDMVKVPERFRPMIYPIKAVVEFKDQEKLTQMLLGKL